MKEVEFKFYLVKPIETLRQVSQELAPVWTSDSDAFGKNKPKIGETILFPDGFYRVVEFYWKPGSYADSPCVVFGIEVL